MNKIDIGCGPNKVEGCYGVDIHAYDGVDQVFDFDQTPWPLESDSYSHIYARHIIEHVASIPNFVNEIHRIATNGAILEIVTPHFSSIDSWQDPSHRWHLSSGWYKPFTEDYLSSQVKQFKHIDTNVGFSRGLFGKVGSGICKISSLKYWEKHFSFVFRARNIHTRLEIIK